MNDIAGILSWGQASCLPFRVIHVVLAVNVSQLALSNEAPQFIIHNP